MKKNYTPISLWKDFDPTEEPLDIHFVRSFEVDGVSVNVSTFCGHSLQKQSSRVLAYTASKPHKGNQPIIILVDPMNRVDVTALCYWANMGFTALGVDYLGESQEHNGLMTIYPLDLSFANFDQAKNNLYRVDDDAKKTCWYEWTVNTKRAITYAQGLSGVNPDKIGLYSLRQGNIIAIMTLATDQRVKAGAVLYGNLWEDLDMVDGNALQTLSPELLAKKMEDSSSNDEWLAAISPQSYLRNIKQPFYTCVGTNSPNTDMDKTYDSLLRMGNNLSGAVLFAPRMMDSMPSNYTSNLQKWFLVQLAEKKNTLKMQDVNVTVSAICHNGKISVEATNCDLPNFKTASLYYSRNRVGTESTRNWVEAPMTKTENGIAAPIKIYDKDTPIVAFCNLTFKNGINVSSNLLKFVPGKLFSDQFLFTEKRSPLLYDGKQGTAEFTPMNIFGSQTTEFIDRHPVSETIGAYGISGVCGTNMGSFVFCDDKLTYQENSLFLMDVFSRESQELEIYLIYNWGQSNHAACKCVCEVKGGNMWQKFTLSQNDFKDTATSKTAKFKDIRAICFVSQKEVVLNNILFTG